MSEPRDQEEAIERGAELLASYQRKAFRSKVQKMLPKNFSDIDLHRCIRHVLNEYGISNRTYSNARRTKGVEDENPHKDDKLGEMRDGDVLMVPMTMMDHQTVDQAMRDEFVAKRYNDTKMNRPGFRTADSLKTATHLARDIGRNRLADAYAEYEQRIQDEYKNPNAGRGDPPDSGTHELQGSKEGQPCTKNGFAGVLKRGEKMRIGLPNPARLWRCRASQKAKIQRQGSGRRQRRI